MAHVAILLGQTPADLDAKTWHYFEVCAWVKAAREHGLRLSQLDEPLRRECLEELKRQSDAETASLPREPNSLDRARSVR